MHPYILHLVNTVDSTQDEAKRFAKTLPKGSVAVVSAESQEGGRGREKRAWASPAGNLYLTFILPVNQEASTLSLVLAGVIAELLHLQIKWPNDLLHNGAKVGGILGEKGDVLFLGLGLNVASHPSLDRPTTSINAISGHAVDLSALRTQVIEVFLAAYEKWLKEGFTPFFEMWKKHLVHQKGDPLSLQGKQAQFVRSDPSGGIVAIVDGQTRLILSGELS